MHYALFHRLSWIAVGWLACGSLFSQSVIRPLSPASKAEPGLEVAVNWKWWVVPAGQKEWGMPLPEELRPANPALETKTPVVARPETYQVKKGDAIIKIARKFDMTPAQLKQFNEMTDDRIQIGQVIRIPTPGQLLTMVPPPPPPPPPESEATKKAAEKKKKDRFTEPPVPEPDLGEAQRELDTVRVQVFLDREMFSPGAIDGQSGATFQRISEIYQRTHADAATPEQLRVKAETAIKEPYTRYVLRADDFKFIKPTKDEPVKARGGGSSAGKKKPKAGKATPPPPPPRPMIDELVAADFLAYTSAWEFVAERFHCDEEFLRRINHHLKKTPVVGTEFQVPNVNAFEIEKAFDTPLQPVADPKKPVTAAIVLVSRLEISCDGKLMAVMPLASARPGLRGRDSWTILDAIPQPRMATKREWRELPKAQPALPPGAPAPSPQPVIDPPLDHEQYLAPGPNNPIGVIWINLAKAKSTEPLPYGLHGTSIPARMGTLQGVGGFRLSNWNIERAARMLPAGTTLQWKAK